jgi:uncharacterized protein YjbI with pentapeptide repeats
MPSFWATYLSDINKAAFYAHEDWVRRGRTGPGRFVLEGKDLSKAEYICRSLGWARLVDCDLSDGKFHPSFDHAELIRCSFRNMMWMNLPGFDGALLEECDFTGAGLSLAGFQDATVMRCRLAGVPMRRGGFDRARIVQTDFSLCKLESVHMDDALVENCDFRGTDFRPEPRNDYLNRFHGVRFIRCDFRGANLDGRRVRDAVFDHCRFHGLVGIPVLEGPCTIIDPDMSEAGDESGVVDGEIVRQQWVRS